MQTAGGYMETTFGECTDNEKKETVISHGGCSGMRTEGTSPPSVGMLSCLLRSERAPCNPCACSARKPAFDIATVPGRPAGPRKEQRRTGYLRVRTACVSRVFGLVALWVSSKKYIFLCVTLFSRPIQRKNHGYTSKIYDT